MTCKMRPKQIATIFWIVILLFIRMNNRNLSDNYAIPATDACNFDHHDDKMLESVKTGSDDGTSMLSTGLGQDINLKEIMNFCNESWRTPMDFLEELNTTGKFSDETDKTPMCYVRCYMEKVGILNDGKINEKKVRELIWPATGDSLIVCENEGDDVKHPCIRAYIITSCMMTRAIVDRRDKDA